MKRSESIYLAGTFDTKKEELLFVKNCIDNAIDKVHMSTVTVDLSTLRATSSLADIAPNEVAACHPEGKDAVFTGDRGSAIEQMSLAFKEFVQRRNDLAGIISLGGSGGTALSTPAMRSLNIGVPKVMVSTMASGNVAHYVGPSDICMMYSVTDIQGINRISERVLLNAAHAIAGMASFKYEISSNTKPAVAVSMFGVTTPCVQAAQEVLEETYDCLVFHATGTGGQSMEKLVENKLVLGVLDITTTEICDHLMGGVLSAGEERLEAVIKTKIPYVGSCGALDMVNFGAKDTVPEHYKNRNLYIHNANVTLMRTTVEENVRIGTWIADKLNRMEGSVRFLIPEKGVSLIDVEGQPFYDPKADKALFDALKNKTVQTKNRRIITLPYAINDPEFSDALVKNFKEITQTTHVGG